LAVNISNKVPPPSIGIVFIIALAFFDDDATAIGQPSDLMARTKRSASGTPQHGGMDQFLQTLLLRHRVGRRAFRGVRHAQRFQGGERGGEAWLARDISLIHRRGEACRVGDALERLPPGGFMRDARSTPSTSMIAAVNTFASWRVDTSLRGSWRMAYS